MMFKPLHMWLAKPYLYLLHGCMHFGGARENVQVLGFAVVRHNVVLGLGGLPDSGFMECVCMCVALAGHVCERGGTCTPRILPLKVASSH